VVEDVVEIGVGLFQLQACTHPSIPPRRITRSQGQRLTSERGRHFTHVFEVGAEIFAARERGFGGDRSTSSAGRSTSKRRTFFGVHGNGGGSVTNWMPSLDDFRGGLAAGLPMLLEVALR
jgi:hypothetical protein